MTATAERRTADRRRGNRVKTALRPFEIKSLDTSARTFQGLAAAWSEDLGGDVIHKGAFKKTLGYWREKGFSIPLLNQHSTYNGIHDVLGSMLEAEEADEGLLSEFEVDDGPDGHKLLRHIERKRLNGLSIGYEAVESEVDSEGVRHLYEIKLMEVSAVIWPMNVDAVIDASSVKSLLSEMTDDVLGELTDALRAEAKARQQAANPTISQEKADELRARLLSLRLRPLLSPARQESAHPTHSNTRGGLAA